MELDLAKFQFLGWTLLDEFKGFFPHCGFFYSFNLWDLGFTHSRYLLDSKRIS